MKIDSCIANHLRGIVFALATAVCLLGFSNIVYGCRATVLFPDKSELADKIRPIMERSLSTKCELVDPSLAQAAFDSENFSEPYNLSVDDARNFSAAAGIDFFILVKSDVQRRASFERGEVFEAYCSTFLVDGRSGALLRWDIASQNSEVETKSVEKMLDHLNLVADNLSQSFDELSQRKRIAKSVVEDYQVIDVDDPSQKLRAPAPYKRISPEYTNLARLYGIEATVEALVYIDSSGKAKHISIVRWAGFGLDESVFGALMEMNWWPAQKNGVTIPSRILVKYNFKKLPK